MPNQLGFLLDVYPNKAAVFSTCRVYEKDMTFSTRNHPAVGTECDLVFVLFGTFEYALGNNPTTWKELGCRFEIVKGFKHS